MNYKKEVSDILDKIKIKREDDASLIDMCELTGDDFDDLQRRKFIVDILIAKKFRLFKKFPKIFFYKTKIKFK
jgi:hypothetical protein